MLEARIKRITLEKLAGWFEEYSKNDGRGGVGERGFLRIQLADVNKLEEFESLSEKDLKNYKVEIKRIPLPKSKDMNSYMWQLCSKIADALYDKSKRQVSYTKNEIYRKAIREVGIYDDFIMLHEAVPRFVETWGVIDGKKHIGYFTDLIKEDGHYTRIRAYYGSSAYNSDELRRLTNNVVEMAKEEGIETATPAQLAELEALWKQEYGNG